MAMQPVLDADAALQRRHREADLRVAREKGGEIGEQHEGDRVLLEQLREGLAPALGFGHEQDPSFIGREKTFHEPERVRRMRFDRQRGRR